MLDVYEHYYDTINEIMYTLNIKSLEELNNLCMINIPQQTPQKRKIKLAHKLIDEMYEEELIDEDEADRLSHKIIHLIRNNGRGEE